MKFSPQIWKCPSRLFERKITHTYPSSLTQSVN